MKNQLSCGAVAHGERDRVERDASPVRSVVERPTLPPTGIRGSGGFAPRISGYTTRQISGLLCPRAMGRPSAFLDRAQNLTL